MCRVLHEKLIAGRQEIQHYYTSTLPALKEQSSAPAPHDSQPLLPTALALLVKRCYEERVNLLCIGTVFIMEEIIDTLGLTGILEQRKSVGLSRVSTS